MGAWGTRAFDNDVACDWAGHLYEVADLSLVRSAIGAIQNRSDRDLPAAVIFETIAACEVVAGLAGRPGRCDAYSEAADVWVRAHPGAPTDHDLSEASAVLFWIGAPRSKLEVIWVDMEWAGRWRAAIANLRARLQAARRAAVPRARS